MKIRGLSSKSGTGRGFKTGESWTIDIPQEEIQLPSSLIEPVQRSESASLPL